MDLWTYGNSFEITFVDRYTLYIDSTAKNGIKTPEGISVGDDIRKLYGIYGPAKKVTDSASHIYYNDSNDVYMAFSVKNDKIIAIKILIFE